MCRLFDKAAIVGDSETTSTTPINPWRLCTVTQVEELKTVLRVIPVAMTTMFLYITIAQVPLSPPLFLLHILIYTPIRPWHMSLWHCRFGLATTTVAAVAGLQAVA